MFDIQNNPELTFQQMIIEAIIVTRHRKYVVKDFFKRVAIFLDQTILMLLQTSVTVLNACVF